MRGLRIVEALYQQKYDGMPLPSHTQLLRNSSQLVTQRILDSDENEPQLLLWLACLFAILIVLTVVTVIILVPCIENGHFCEQIGIDSDDDDDSDSFARRGYGLNHDLLVTQPVEEYDAPSKSGKPQNHA